MYSQNQITITGSKEQIQSAIQFISKLPLSQVRGHHNPKRHFLTFFKGAAPIHHILH